MCRRFAVFGSALLFPVLAISQCQLTTDPLPKSQPKTSSAVSSALSKDFEVSASGGWLDTGINVNPGDKITISSAGTLRFQPLGTAGPEGLARSWHDVMQSLPLNSAGRGAVIGRIGDDPAVVPFLIGSKKDFTVARPGHLYLRVNLADNESLDGSFKAAVQVTPAGTANVPQPASLQFNPALLSQIPRRVTDATGGVGDMVNFVLIGSQAQMLEAFSSGGWVQVDRTKGEAVVHAIFSTIQKQSYLEMPMSELYLFGRPQDFGMARAEPIAVVQTRHHLRVWKAPFQVDGQDVWVGAATHDLGFEKDQRNGSVTHRIDPNVDDERDFVRASLTEGGGIAADAYSLPKDSVQQAKTATGGAFHSDGRLIVMQLRALTSNARTAEISQ
jgi:LssY C-terminus